MITMRGLGTCLALGALASTPLAAQSALSLSAGAASYDLSGVGTSATVAVRYEIPFASGLRAQVGAGYFWYDSQGADRVAMLLPEAGVLAYLPVGIPIYLGAGVGHSIRVKGRQNDDVSLHAAAGVDIAAGNRWAVRPEFRMRTIDPWAGTIGDFTLGVRRTLGR